MTRLLADPRLPSDQQQLVLRLATIIRDLTNQLNNLTEGRVSAVQNAQATIPTAGTNAVGDFVRNSVPVELGVAASKYVVFGWVCTVAGTPGTWLPVRTLTGN
jgi:hypothetical protein